MVGLGWEINRVVGYKGGGSQGVVRSRGDGGLGSQGFRDSGIKGW